MRFGGRLAAGALSVLVAVGLSACDPRTPVTPGGSVNTLVVSEAWRASAPDEEERPRIAALQRAIQQLRDETGTGWIGRQDDVTGYLADLSGGSRLGSPLEFMEDYGAALFGIDGTVLDLAEPDTSTVPGMVSVRASQRVGAVPVRDAHLLFFSRAASSASAARLTGVRGRVFPGLTVSTDPRIGRREAALIARKDSGGEVRGRTSLVVLPTGDGILAWEVTIVGGPELGANSALFYVDAMTGDVLEVRPQSIEGDAELPVSQPRRMTRMTSDGPRTSRATAPGDPDPSSVQISGADPLGRPLTAHGLQTAAGVELTDTTTASWDATTRRGGVMTHDMRGSDEDSELPGPLIVSPTTQVEDPEAIAAQTYGRAILRYYEDLGRNSWDGDGGTLTMSVNYGPESFCNAFFNGEQMVFGNPCVRNGEQLSRTYVDIDMAGHEITHGVTHTTAGLIYIGQSGALNESFSDYLGNVIGNRFKGEDTVALAEDTCAGITNPVRCFPNPDGSASNRYMLNGNDFDQYLRMLDPGVRLKELEFSTQDNGGVHYNSQIWNNALWSIRTQLARIDNQSGNDSLLAQAFDRVVYAVLTTRLGPTSGFLDARAAVEQVIVDSGLDPVVLRVAREVFDLNKICAGCPAVTPPPGEAVSTAVQSQLQPAVSDDLVAWLDLSAGNRTWGHSALTRIGGAAPILGPSKTVLQVAFAGEALVTLDADGQIVRTDPDVGAQLVAEVDARRTLLGGFGGSDAGAAWHGGGDTVSFLDPAGTLSTVGVEGLQGDTIAGVGTGGGLVGVGTRGGKVFAWRPGSAPTRVGTLPDRVVALSAYGDTVLAVDGAGHARLLGLDGRSFVLSNRALPFSAALSSEYAVWTEAIGSTQAGVVPETVQKRFPETDLYVMSLATGKIYSLVSGTGQQGFPALSGRRLVWQDAGLGGDDIRTMVLPEGL